MEFGTKLLRFNKEGMVSQKRRSAAVVWREGSAQKSLRVDIGDELAVTVCIVPIVLDTGFLMDGQKVFENLFFSGSIGYIRITAGIPFNIYAVGLFVSGKDINAAAAQLDLGRVRMGGADAADGALI
ncbi:hypothetical protein SDC9_187593 [bioreactor metagenome]|uniref:Uncharacterized protein n=1 Tax=bioreactor metagenome TaxID=1076179 RepID=A0A645HLZ7_9ZZZZ